LPCAFSRRRCAYAGPGCAVPEPRCVQRRPACAYARLPTAVPDPSCAVLRLPSAVVDPPRTARGLPSASARPRCAAPLRPCAVADPSYAFPEPETAVPGVPEADYFLRYATWKTVHGQPPRFDHEPCVDRDQVSYRCIFLMPASDRSTRSDRSPNDSANRREMHAEVRGNLRIAVWAGRPGGAHGFVAVGVDLGDCSQRCRRRAALGAGDLDVFRGSRCALVHAGDEPVVARESAVDARKKSAGGHCDAGRGGFSRGRDERLRGSMDFPARRIKPMRPRKEPCATRDGSMRPSERISAERNGSLCGREGHLSGRGRLRTPRIDRSRQREGLLRGRKGISTGRGHFSAGGSGPVRGLRIGRSPDIFLPRHQEEPMRGRFFLRRGESGDDSAPFRIPGTRGRAGCRHLRRNGGPVPCDGGAFDVKRIAGTRVDAGPSVERAIKGWMRANAIHESVQPTPATWTQRRHRSVFGAKARGA
jgi:hypothetical protein